MKSYSRRKRARFVWLFYITMVLFIFLIYRLINVQAYENENLAKIAEWQHNGKAEISSLRGSIFDRNGSTLAFSMALPSIAANPRKIRDPDHTALYLSLALGRDKKRLLKILKSPVSFVWIARKIDLALAKKIERLDLQGVFIVNEASGKRFYPKKSISSHVLGFTNIDDEGIEGIEVSYDKILAGKKGVLEAEMDEPGRLLPGGKIKFIPPTPGKDIYLTIDETIQFIVERELEKAIKKHKAEGGTVIVYNPKNGDILAMANYPDYNSSEAFKVDKKFLRNRAITDNYEPGSTFKVILAAAALDSGRVTTSDRFYSGDSIALGGYNFGNAVDGLYSYTGYEDIEGVITYSFNTGAISIGLRIGKELYYKYIAKLGFGKQTGIDLPGEAEGILPHVKYWKLADLATISFGQTISVTPIQMVQAYGALANEGKLMKPRLVKKIVNHDGKIYRINKPEVVAQVFKPKTCRNMLKILKNTCENGTGKKALIPNYTIGGKTGTANVVENGVYSSKLISSFIGIASIENPQVVILVKIDDPKGVAWGGAVAAPVFHQIGSQILWRMGVQPKIRQTAAKLSPPDSVDYDEKEKKEGE